MASSPHEEDLRAFVDYAPVAIAMFDEQMCYVAASGGWRSDYLLAGELEGRSHYEVFPEIPERWRQVHRRAHPRCPPRTNDDIRERVDASEG